MQRLYLIPTNSCTAAATTALCSSITMCPASGTSSSRAAGICCARKRLSLGGVVLNLGRQLAQLGYFAWCILIKGLITLRLGAVTKVLGNPSGTWPY